MKKTLLALTAACLLITACKQNVKKPTGDADKDIKEMVKTSPGLNAGTGTFNIEAIEGWSKIDTNFSGLKSVLLKSEIEGNADVFMENITVVTEKAQGLSVDDYFDANLKTMTGQMPGFSKIESGKVTVNNLEGRRLIYSHSYTGSPIDVAAYFFVKDDIGYVITCSTEKGKLNKWQPVYDKIINTFTVN